jgi:hypothetical protein
MGVAVGGTVGIFVLTNVADGDIVCARVSVGVRAGVVCEWQPDNIKEKITIIVSTACKFALLIAQPFCPRIEMIF